MSDGRNEILNILKDNLSDESKWFLFVLKQENGPLYKEKLWELSNKMHESVEKKRGNNEVEVRPLINSRYVLDLHTARLEGAGLVKVNEIGRVRMYNLTALGEELLKYIANQNIN